MFEDFSINNFTSIIIVLQLNFRLKVRKRHDHPKKAEHTSLWRNIGIITDFILEYYITLPSSLADTAALPPGEQVGYARCQPGRQ